jgi:hypothetical protein
MLEEVLMRIDQEVIPKRDFSTLQTAPSSVKSDIYRATFLQRVPGSFGKGRIMMADDQQAKVVQEDQDENEE